MNVTLSKRFDCEEVNCNWFLVLETRMKKLAIELHDNDKLHPFEGGKIDENDVYEIIKFLLDSLRKKGE